MAGNQMSIRELRFINVENGGNANVQSSIVTMKVEHSIGAGNWLSMRALEEDTAGNQMSTQATRCQNTGNGGKVGVQSSIDTPRNCAGNDMMNEHNREQSIESHEGMYPFAYVQIDQSVEQAFIP